MKIMAQGVNLPNYTGTGFKFSGGKIGDIVSALLPYVYVLAGMGLLLMLVMGGIGLMTGGGDQGKMKASYGKITGALIGFLIIFVSYFVVQLVEVMLGVNIL